MPAVRTSQRVRAAIRLLVALSLSSAAGAAAARAQTPAAPTDSAGMARAMGSMLSQMGPMYKTIAQAMIDGTLTALEQPATVDRLAAATRRYYEALLKQGFSKDEALHIVAAGGLLPLRTAK